MAIPKKCDGFTHYLNRVFRAIRAKKKPRRDYRLERECYDARPERKQKHASRLRARRKLASKGLVKTRDGKHIHHRNGDANDNRAHNLRVIGQREHARIHSRDGA